MFTTVTFPDPDGFQTSDVAMVGEGTAVAALLGVEASVGVEAGVGDEADARMDEVAGAADARPVASEVELERGLDVPSGRPVARTTPVTRSRQRGTPSPVRTARPTACRRFGRAIVRNVLRSSGMFCIPSVRADNPIGMCPRTETSLNVSRAIATRPLRPLRDGPARRARGPIGNKDPAAIRLTAVLWPRGRGPRRQSKG